MLLPHSAANISRLGPACIHVLKSKWHAEHVDALVDRFLAVMAEAGCDFIPVHTLSGCLEMPLAAQDIFEMERGRLEAVVCFGVLMKGETAHFEMVLNTMTAAFAQLTLAARVPVINAILPASRIEHVLERSGDNDLNKGIEAALATVETVLWRRDIRARALP
ncbi:MAG: 6,7-dimethyl-8-ribityllumazine synthase [Proteobacteria bacterium]|nr:6,7-dimethyl-8-ribityllumazine synthase [Pseudomonadota bacterium]